MHLPPVRLLCPGPLDAVSGGYIYNRRIIGGLRALGHDVAMLALDGRHPLPDEAAEASARAVLGALPAGTLPVVDSLGLPAFAGLAAELRARRAVALIHHPTALETGITAEVSAALRARETLALSAMRRVIVTSGATARALAAFGVPAGRIGVVLPGNDPMPRSEGSRGVGPVSILSIGTLVPRKGHDVLVRALAAIPDLDWRLTIVGSAGRDPDCAAQLRAIMAETGLGQRITLAGELSDEALAPLWRTADIFALATHYEGYGMAFAEALRRGVPVAGTKGGAVGEVATGDGCALCKPGDAVTLGKVLRRMICDTDVRAQMAEAAWATGQALPDWTAQAAAFAAELARAGADADADADGERS
ncbi:MAG: glycosyltransferase family 4 protein [Alphaproteobacteria bacterium]|nr:glycosyltransferase family 4 protein [Alphaproteobacteria bacterium]